MYNLHRAYMKGFQEKKRYQKKMRTKFEQAFSKRGYLNGQ